MFSGSKRNRGRAHTITDPSLFEQPDELAFNPAPQRPRTWHAEEEFAAQSNASEAGRSVRASSFS